MNRNSNLSADDIEDLTLFVEHVSELRSSRFAQRVLNPKEITYTWGGGSTVGEFLNFDEEECRSFILGCRLLMQDNERSSIRRIWTMFKDQIAKPEWFIKVNPPRWMLNDYLDTNAIIAAPGGGTVTNRLILETFLYGSYAHFNREHRKRFKEWGTDSRQFPHMKLWFLVALQTLLKSATPMADAVAEFLATVKSSDDGESVEK